MQIATLSVALLAIASPDATHTSSAAEHSDGDSMRPVWLGVATLVGVAGVAAVGRVAWWDQGTRPFHFTYEGWFANSTYAGGSDKLGHAYAAYISTIAMQWTYNKLGIDPVTAAWMGAGFTFLLFNGFEFLGDGFTQYGASPEDMVANTFGLTIGFLVRRFPVLDTIIGLRLGYIPTTDFLAHDHTPLKLINDYSGMLFYFDVKLKGLLEVLHVEPGLARFLMAGLVYDTYKYSPILDRNLTRRGFGVYAGISLPEVLHAWAGDDPGVDGIATFFKYYAVPFLTIAIMEDLNHNKPYLNFGIANRFEVGL
jgi:hypothetical protein